MKFTIDELFAGAVDYADHECCECCVGYCPAQEDDWKPEPIEIIRCVSKHGEYISDRYVAVSSDLVDLGDHELACGTNDKPANLDRTNPAYFVPLENKPNLSPELFTPSKVRNLLKSGFTIHEAPHGQPQHLYLGDRHVGFVMPVRTPEEVAKIGVYSNVATTLDGLQRVAAYLAETNGRFRIVTNGDIWDIAASILNEAKRIQAVLP